MSFYGTSSHLTSFKAKLSLPPVVLTAINATNVKAAAYIQVVTTVAKLLALVIIIVGGIVRMAQGKKKLNIAKNRTHCGMIWDIAILSFYFFVITHIKNKL